MTNSLGSVRDVHCPGGASLDRISYDARQQHWREFLLGDDPNEQVVSRSDWTIGDDA